MNYFHLLGLLWLVWTSQAEAAVSLSGTRLVFDGRFTEVSIEARNRGTREVLLQAWLEALPGAGESAVLPFVLTPPLSKLAPNGRQSLRLMYAGRGMPADRESLLHLYVMEIPRAGSGEGQLSIAIRQRINVLFRPKGLPGDPAATPEALRWVLERGDREGARLKVENLTAFHAVLVGLELTDEHDTQPLGDDLLLAPGESRELRLTAQAATAGQRLLRFNALTDYCGQRTYSARVDFDVLSSAMLVDAALSSDQHGLSHD